ncbi:response regulator receiver protein [Mycolicibacterium agri]|uniref:Response regulator receiver protein n=2 Tax=Mycolicibacterium agri TaxID=36811 RepID=A0A2A7MSC2_MYCAG|nr:response regulator receiver protein [Mycolicibacterium agri]GFG50823.1 hypothetical protein MAGR_22640 [Mycolicibacterium agri]
MGVMSNRQLAEVLGDLAIEMQARTDVDEILRSILGASVYIVAGARWAGISRVEHGRVESAVTTDPVAAELDRLQSDLGDGPALSTLRERETVFVKDLAEETRWPQYVKTALGLGVRCLLSFRLFTTKQSYGALNLYGASAGAFDDDSQAIGEILAQHAAVAMAGAAAEEQFHTALASRDIIGQAKGILMQRDRLTGLQAFAALTRASQETNINWSTSRAGSSPNMNPISTAKIRIRRSLNRFR